MSTSSPAVLALAPVVISSEAPRRYPKPSADMLTRTMRLSRDDAAATLRLEHDPELRREIETLRVSCLEPQTMQHTELRSEHRSLWTFVHNAIHNVIRRWF